MSARKLAIIGATALLFSCSGSTPLSPPPPPDGGLDSSPDVGLDSQPDDVQRSCKADPDCPASDTCVGDTCIPRCAPAPSMNLVNNSGFDHDIWTDSDKDRGWGNEPPRWDSMDSVGCPTSGSLVVTQRTAFSAPFAIGPVGTKYYWGFRLKNTNPAGGAQCEVHFCTDLSCTYFLTSEIIQSSTKSSDWERLAYWLTVPEAKPPTPTPYARIACNTYGSEVGYFDRFFFSSQPLPY